MNTVFCSSSCNQLAKVVYRHWFLGLWILQCLWLWKWVTKNLEKILRENWLESVGNFWNVCYLPEVAGCTSMFPRDCGELPVGNFEKINENIDFVIYWNIRLVSLSITAWTLILSVVMRMSFMLQYLGMNLKNYNTYIGN